MDPQAPPPPPYAPPPAQPPEPWGTGIPPQQVPYTPMPAQPAPKKKGTNWAALIVLLVVVGVIAGGYWLFRDRLSGNVTELRVGDCFDEPATFISVSDVQHQPCTSPHDAEVVALVTDQTAGGTAYPGREYFRTQLLEKCGPAVSSYIGTDVNAQQVYDYGLFFPNDDGWNDGDRGITCYVYAFDDSKLTQSVRGAGVSPQ